MRRARPTGRLWSVAWPARPALVHRALRWAGETRGRCGRSTRRNTACLRPDLLSALPSCLRRLPPVCPQAHRQTIPLRRPSPARPKASTMRPMWFGEEPTVEPSCAVDPTGPSSAIAHPITAVWSSADRTTDIAHPITAVRSSAAGLTGLSSADVAGNRRRPLLGRGRGRVGNLSRRRVLNGLRDPGPFAPTWPGDA
jgi:hypothetical protein